MSDDINSIDPFRAYSLGLLQGTLDAKEDLKEKLREAFEAAREGLSYYESYGDRGWDIEFKEDPDFFKKAYDTFEDWYKKKEK